MKHCETLNQTLGARAISLDTSCQGFDWTQLQLAWYRCQHDINVPDTDPRLQRRYLKLVEQHLSPAHAIAAGLRIVPQAESAMTSAKGAYRFYANEEMSLVKTFEPLKAHAAAAISSCQEWALAIHDWSPLHYTDHKSKKDRIVLYNKNDHGYLLQAALLVSDRDGAPLSPLYLGVEASDGVHSTRREGVLPRRPEIDELNRTMGHIEQQGLPLPIAHIVDREADSINHLRRFVRCNRKFVIRSNDLRRVEYREESRLLREVEEAIKDEFHFSRDVQYKGRAAKQYVTEVTVTLNGEGHKQRVKNGTQTSQRIKGPAISLRLIIAQVRDAEESVLATWRLWSNLPESVSADTIALWYYWRWRIESYFKLLKRAGQHVEQWQQESAEAIAKRLIVAAQACVIVWSLMESTEPETIPLKRALIRMSGRLMKHKVEWTAPALLAGMWQLLMILDTLDQYPIDELKAMGRQVRRMLGSEHSHVKKKCPN